MPANSPPVSRAEARAWPTLRAKVLWKEQINEDKSDFSDAGPLLKGGGTSWIRYRRQFGLKDVKSFKTWRHRKTARGLWACLRRGQRLAWSSERARLYQISCFSWEVKAGCLWTSAAIKRVLFSPQCLNYFLNSFPTF